LAASLFSSIIVLRFAPGLFKWILILNALELVRAIAFRKSWSELFGRMKNFIFKSSYRAYPTDFYASEGKYLPAVALVFVLASTGTEQAAADYQLVDSLSYDREIAQNTIGTQPGDVVNGFCDQCPLELAIQQIVPDSLVLLWSDSLDKSMRVTWNGPDVWGTLLQQMAIENDLYVIVRPQDATGRNSVEVSEAPTGRGAFIAETSRNASLYGEATSAYVLRAGENLPDNLNQWAARQGKRIAWELDRRPIIDFDARFNGSLIDAIEQVMSAYRARGQMTEVRVVPMANNVIVITNRGGSFQ
jgi:hypothetical protein